MINISCNSLLLLLLWFLMTYHQNMLIHVWFNFFYLIDTIVKCVFSTLAENRERFGHFCIENAVREVARLLDNMLFTPGLRLSGSDLSQARREGKITRLWWGRQRGSELFLKSTLRELVRLHRPSSDTKEGFGSLCAAVTRSLPGEALRRRAVPLSFSPSVDDN